MEAAAFDDMDGGVSRTPVGIGRPVVLFVGSFATLPSGQYWGGQAYACRALVESPLREMVDFVLLDTTAVPARRRPFYAKLIVGLSRFGRFMWLLARHRPRVVLLFSSYGWSFVEKGLMAMAAHWSGVRVVFAPRSGHLIDDVYRSAFFRRYAKAVFARCQVVVCQAQYWKRFFVEHFGLAEDRAMVIPNFVVELPPWPIASTQANDGMEMLFLGSVVRAKGVYEIVEAARQLQGLPLRWHIAGDGRDFAELKRLVEGDTSLKERVHMYGWIGREQKEQLFRRCQVFVLPSYREGFPNSLLEAMSWGLVPIATDVGAIPEVVEDGQNGYVIRPGDVERLAQVVKKLAGDRALLDRLRLAARKTVEEKFVVSKVLPLWQRALGIAE